MITKKQWQHAKNGTAFYWKSDMMVKWIFVKVSPKMKMVVFGWDNRIDFPRYDSFDDSGAIWLLEGSTFEELTQVEKETQDLIYPLNKEDKK